MVANAPYQIAVEYSTENRFWNNLAPATTPEAQ